MVLEKYLGANKHSSIPRITFRIFIKITKDFLITDKKDNLVKEKIKSVT